MAKHFDEPTQVVFTCDNGINRERCAGIAYGDQIICGCCGGIFEMEDIVIEKEVSWGNLYEAICPDEDYGEIEDEKEEEIEDKYTLDDLGNNWY